MTLFLETEKSNNASLEIQGNTEVKTMWQNIIRLIKAFIYYQPPMIFTRMCFRWTSWTIKITINALLELLPYLTGDDTKGLKFTVEKLLGFLIGFFGPVIGYDYEKVRATVANKKGKALGIKPQDPTTEYDENKLNANKAKFSCDVKIHKYGHASDPINTARRQSMAPSMFGLGGGRRMSMSTDRLHQHPPHLPSRQLSDHNLTAEADKLKRSSMAPGSLDSMMPHKSRHFSGGSIAHSHRDVDDRDSVHDSFIGMDEESEMQEFLNMEDNDDADSFCIEEDNSELLSMQVESYMDTE